jgi:hypothetical protein
MDCRAKQKWGGVSAVPSQITYHTVLFEYFSYSVVTWQIFCELAQALLYV